MCLIKREERARIATAPLKVYKILMSDGRSPYMYHQYYVGKNTPQGHDIFSSAGLTIDGGYLHAYMSEHTALRHLRWMQNSYAECELIVVEMYIPQGTEYWLGSGQEVAARCLEWPDNAKVLYRRQIDDQIVPNQE